MSSSIDNLKLHYFDMGTFGRGENVRLLLEDAGVKYEYISRKLGKYSGRNDEEAQRVDAAADLIIEWVAKWVNALMSGDEALLESYKEEYLPQQLDLWNTILSISSPYILGDEVSYADFGLYHILESNNKEMKIDVDKYPNIQAFADAIEARPNISKYFATGRK